MFLVIWYALTGRQGLLHLCPLMHPPHAMQTPGKRSAAFYHLHAQLTAPWEVHNILAEAEAASSTGKSTSSLVLSGRRALADHGVQLHCDAGR